MEGFPSRTDKELLISKHLFLKFKLLMLSVQDKGVYYKAERKLIRKSDRVALANNKRMF